MKKLYEIFNKKQPKIINFYKKSMIKQDYLLRMIEEIISMIVIALLGKKKIKQKQI